MTCISLSPGVQPVPVRQRADARQRLLQEAGGQEVAQHGQSELHQEVHQALERRLVHAGDHPEGTERETGSLQCRAAFRDQNLSFYT